MNVELFREFCQTHPPADQAALDDLLQKASSHLMAEKAAGYDLTHLIRLLSLLIEEHKEIARLRRQAEELKYQYD